MGDNQLNRMRWNEQSLMQNLVGMYAAWKQQEILENLTREDMSMTKATQDNEITRQLSRYVVNAVYETVPVDVVHAAKRCLIDWMGVALGGSNHRGVDSILHVVERVGCRGKATIIGRKRRTDALHAALINGYMSHVLDYDDTNIDSFVHPSAPVWPAIAAASSIVNFSGKDALLAFILGYEMENRIGTVLFKRHDERGWHMSGMVGGFGAAAAVGKLLSLNVSQMSQAFGIAATYSSGLREMFGTMSKSLHPGKAAMSGLYAALLVQAGFTSSEHVLETPRGFFAVNAGEDSIEGILDDIGEYFGILHNSVKPYSCGVVVHPTIDGILQIKNQNGISWREVSHIKAEVNPMVLDVTGKRLPQTGLDGKFSIYHCIAVALLDGACGPDQFSDQKVHDPHNISIRGITSVTVNPDFAHEEARIHITLKNGNTLHAHIAHASGTPENPISDDDLMKKYNSMAEPVLGVKQTRMLSDTIWMGDKLADFEEIISLSAATSR